MTDMDKSLAQFNKDLVKGFEALNLTVQDVVEAVVVQLFQNIDSTTPRDTGRARLSWLLDVDSTPRSGTGQKRKTKASDARIAAHVEKELERMTKGLSKDSQYHIYTNLAYMPVLNDGRNGKPHSKQNFKFVEKAIVKEKARIEKTVKAIAKRRAKDLKR